MRKFIIFLYVLLSLQLPSSNTQAAFPITTSHQHKNEKFNEQLEKLQEHQVEKTLPADNNKAKKEDDGIYGILSFVTALLGIFPAAIILGIIGMERHREYRGLATAGFVIGLFYALIILLIIASAIGFLFWI